MYIMSLIGIDLQCNKKIKKMCVPHFLRMSLCVCIYYIYKNIHINIYIYINNYIYINIHVYINICTCITCNVSVMTHMSTNLRGLSQQWTVLTAHVHAHQIESVDYDGWDDQICEIDSALSNSRV